MRPSFGRCGEERPEVSGLKGKKPGCVSRAFLFVRFDYLCDQVARRMRNAAHAAPYPLSMLVFAVTAEAGDATVVRIRRDLRILNAQPH